MVQVSGLALTTIPKFITEKFGTDGLEKWRGNLEPDTRLVFDKTIVVNQWFDLDQFMVIPMQVLTRLFYKDEETCGRELGRFSADFGLNGVLKVFMKIGSINYFVKRSAVVIPNYYQSAIMEVIVNDKEHAQITLSEFPNLHPLIEYRIAGWMERALEICGGNQPEVQVVKSLTRGDAHTLFDITW